MMFWSNLVGYQIVWFVSVIGASRGLVWPSLAAGSVFVLSQIFLADFRSVEIRLLAVAIVFGIVIDGMLARMEWARYAASPPSIPMRGAPVWILMLWSSFAMTINRSLAYVRDRWCLALPFAAVGAPLAYLGAQRGWDAVTFQTPTWHGLVWIAASWAVSFPLLCLLSRQLLANARAAVASPRIPRR